MQFCNKLGIKVHIHHISNCPLCGKQEFEERFTCRDYYATGETFHLYECKECHFLFTQDFPSQTSIDKYYCAENYISHSDTQRGLVNKLYHIVRRFMLKRKSALVEKHSKGKRLLDIGTGTGYFAQAMKQKGWEVTAIEKSPQARVFAQKHFGLKIDAPELLDSYETGYFNVITLWHVLEHIEDLPQMWERLKEILHEEGTLILALPNPSSYDANHYKQNWAAYDVPRHLWHFTPATLAKWASLYGFTVKKQIPMPFDAFYISMLSEKNESKTFSTLRGFWRGFLAWIATRRNASLSSSIIYILKKQK